MNSRNTLVAPIVAIGLFMNIQAAGAQCLPAFTADETNCPTVSFTDFSTSTSGVIVAWSWDFGDGNIANTPNTFTANGTYLVCLTITTSSFCSSNFCKPITIDCINAASATKATPAKRATPARPPSSWSLPSRPVTTARRAATS